MRIIENEGGGAVLGVPGYSGAIRAKLDDTGNVLEVVPWGQPFKDEIAPQPVEVSSSQSEDEATVPPEPVSQGG